MRKLGIIANVIVLMIVIFSVIDEPPSGDEIILAVLIFAHLIITLIALFSSTDNGWLALYFKRRRLEEEAKVAELEKKIEAEKETNSQ